MNPGIKSYQRQQLHAGAAVAVPQSPARYRDAHPAEKCMAVFASPHERSISGIELRLMVNDGEQKSQSATCSGEQNAVAFAAAEQVRHRRNRLGNRPGEQNKQYGASGRAPVSIWAVERPAKDGVNGKTYRETAIEFPATKREPQIN